MSSSAAIMKEQHIDLTISDSDSDVVITRTPRQPLPQFQSQPGSRHRKPISPPALNRQPTDSLQNNESITISSSMSRGMKAYLEDNAKATAKNSSISVKPLFKSAHNPHPQSATPPSAKKQVDGHKTPKTQTPKKTEWTVEKLEEKLRKFAQDIGLDTAKLTASLIQSSWKRKNPQRHFISKNDCFAGIRLMPSDASGKPSDTMRIKTKVCLLETPSQVFHMTNCSLASRPGPIWEAGQARKLSCHLHQDQGRAGPTLCISSC